jgi:1-acyl-sn-glycerol-3-phosphate acyltransferase
MAALLSGPMEQPPMLSCLYSVEKSEKRVNSILSILFIVYFFTLAAIFYPLAILIALVSGPLDPTKKWLHQFSGFFMNRLLWASPFWQCSIQGQEHLRSGGPFVLVANHQSLADIVILYALRCHFKWVAKRELFWVPLFGWSMALNDYVCLKRGDLASTRDMIRVCQKWLRLGVSVLIFPEGTRSPDGSVKQFHDGAFRLAKLCNAPVVPIAIAGTHAILPKGSWTLSFRGRMQITVLPPVHIKDFDGDANALKTYVVSQIKQHVEPVRERKPQSATCLTCSYD